MVCDVRLTRVLGGWLWVGGLGCVGASVIRGLRVRLLLWPGSGGAGKGHRRRGLVVCRMLVNSNRRQVGVNGAGV